MTSRTPRKLSPPHSPAALTSSQTVVRLLLGAPVRARAALVHSILLVIFCGGMLPVSAQLPAAERQIQLDSFEKVWTTIRDKHWEKNPGGLDWQAIHEEFRPKVEKAQTADQVRAALKEMLGRLHQTHFGILPATVSRAIGDAVSGDGSPGFDVRVLDAQAVVTSVDPNSPAERAGVKPGWAISSVNGDDVSGPVRELARDSSIPEITLTRVVLARLSGPVGGKMRVTFLNAAGESVPLELDLSPPRGKSSRFGNLPEQNVWFESRRLGRSGYVRFNLFLDPAMVMEGFGNAIAECKDCDGLIIDVRGNPGGIGVMAMGMAGYLVDKSGLRLGSMYTRDTTLNFIINPRMPVFTGPVAILVDGCSASTAEIFAGGLKDLGRARVFGTRTAAAALPSVIERLPNGDAFQYAMANYISEGGKPLEGVGVQPDVEIKLSRQALLAGHDPVVDTALDWIQKQRTR